MQQWPCSFSHLLLGPHAHGESMATLIQGERPPTPLLLITIARSDSTISCGMWNAQDRCKVVNAFSNIGFKPDSPRHLQLYACDQFCPCRCRSESSLREFGSMPRCIRYGNIQMLAFDAVLAVTAGEFRTTCSGSSLEDSTIVTSTFRTSDHTHEMYLQLVSSRSGRSRHLLTQQKKWAQSSQQMPPQFATLHNLDWGVCNPLWILSYECIF